MRLADGKRRTGAAPSRGLALVGDKVNAISDLALTRALKGLREWTRHLCRHITRVATILSFRDVALTLGCGRDCVGWLPITRAAAALDGRDTSFAPCTGLDGP